MRRTLRRNSPFVLVVSLSAIVIAAMATAAPAQMNAARLSVALKKHRSVRSGQQPPLFSQPIVYNDGGDGVHAVVIADLNGDGKPDVIAGNSGGIAVMLGNGDGTLQTPVEYSGGAGELWWPGGLGVADLRKIGKLDAVVANSGGGNGGDDSVGVLLGNGDGTFQPAVLYDSGGSLGIVTMVLADLDGDGKTDIILLDGGSITALLGNGDGTFQPATMILENTGEYGWGGIALADLNGDGKLDLAVTMPYFNSGSAYVSVLLGNGDGTFQPPVNYPISGGLYLTSMAIADVNGDKKLDLVIGDLAGNGVNVLLGNGDGTFQPMQNFGSGGVDSISVADVNGDGKKDLVITCCSGAGNGSSGEVGVLLGNGDGTFQDQVDYGVGAGVIESMAAAVADMNGDGKMDVVAASLCYVSQSNCVPPGAVSVLLHAYSSTTTLASSLNPSVFGQSVTFTASVSAAFGTPGGTVEFQDGSNELGSATLTNGSASLPVSSLAVATHSITAAYQGGPGYTPSTSSAVNQVVNIATTTTSLASSMNPVTINEYVTYTATVTSQYGGAATGTATFQDGGVVVSTVTLSGNLAAYTTNYSTVGSHTITATYSGDANNSGSTSAPLVEQVIEGTKTKTALSTSGSPSLIGQEVTFTAKVTPTKGVIPNGEVVSFYDGTTLMGTGTIASGVATFTTSSLTAGKHTIQATYGGDSQFQPSKGKVPQVVDKYATTTSLTSSLNPSQNGQPVTFTAQVTSSGPAPTGKVTFKDGTKVLKSVLLSGGVAAFTTSNLAVGTHAITAQYTGDAANNKSTSPVLDQVVQ